MNKLIVFSALFFLLTLSSSMAAKYGMAGCGLGSLVIGDEPGPVQIAAATTNNIIVPQSSAITSGTSNCTEDGVSLKDKEQQMFVEANYESLIQEMAQGSGEHLQSFATLFGCNGERTNTFTSVMQQNYGSIVDGNSDELVFLGNVQRVYGKHFSETCSVI